MLSHTKGFFLGLMALTAEMHLSPAVADTTLDFNEIMYHPATNEPGLEWVEFYNQMAVDLDISGWRVSGDIHYTFSEGSRVAGRGYIVVALNPEVLGKATNLTNVHGPFVGRLSNNGATLELLNNSARPVDRVKFGVNEEWPPAPDGAGVSLAKLNPETASEPPANWTASDQVGGTPGRLNFSTGNPQPSAVVFNEVSPANGAGFWLELANVGTNTLPLGGYLIRLDGSLNRDYTFPSGVTLAPASLLTLSNAALGFQPTSGDRLYLYPPFRAKVLDAIEVSSRLRGRSPNGAGHWLNPNRPTPGASNTFSLHDEIVINEVMYHPALLRSTNGWPAQESPEQWIELYNRSTNAVDLTGWQIDGGIHFSFPSGRILPPDGYLVVARDISTFRKLYPSIDLAGDFSGRLSRHGDLIVLKDGDGNPADEVRYFDRGHWPVNADGGGSSLELCDPHSDNYRAEAWAASDESGKSLWQTYTYRMTARFPRFTQPTRWNDFVLGLLDGGECVIDDIEVLEFFPGFGAIPILANGTFENGLSGWRVLGTHNRSRVISDPDNPSNHLLHLIATGPQEHMHNHIETTVNISAVVNERDYQISFRAKWLAGNNLLNTRLYFNRVARTTVLPQPDRNGTPGARNSRSVGNGGPTFAELQHTPVIPNPGQPVTVSVTALDPQGVASAALWWSVNGGAWTEAAMNPLASGRYAGEIPAQLAGAVVQFYIRAEDSRGAAATYPSAGPDSGSLYAVADGQADFSQGHNLRIILSPTNRDLLHALTNVMSNAELPGTVIYDETRAYHDVGVRLKGSERGRYSDTRTGFYLKFQPDDLFRGVHPVMAIDRSGAGDSTRDRQREILVQHILHRAGGTAGVYSDLCRVIAPRSIHTGPAILSPRREDEFLETAFQNGGDGKLFELDLIYYPTTANPFGYKNPQPDDVITVDFRDLGDDQELYRYNFLLKNHRAADDYRDLMKLAKTLGGSGPQFEQETAALMDINAWMRTFAFLSLCGVADIYMAGYDHNVLLYQRPSDGRFVPLPIDMDASFSQNATNRLVGTGNLAKVINLPGNLRSYYAHLLDLIGTTYNTAYMTDWLALYNRFVPDQDFISISSYIQQRGSYALSMIDVAGGKAPFSVAGPDLITTDTNRLALSGIAPVQVQSITVNGTAPSISWSTLTNWSLSVPLTASTNVLFIEARDLRGSPLTNYTSTRTVVYSGPLPDPKGAVLINEWMAANAGTRRNPVDGQFDDWFELFNRGTTSIDLGGFFLTDNRANKFLYQIPNTGQYAIPPGGFLLVWANGKPSHNATNRTDLFVNFQLSREGEEIGLFAPDGSQVDAVSFGLQTADISEGRYPDGAESRQFQTMPSPGAPNRSAPSTGPPELIGITTEPGGLISIRFVTIPGRMYRVDYKNDLAERDWLSLAPPQTAQENSMEIDDTSPTRPRRFYRIALLP